ncbi:MAG: reverse transcriptase domain-containing protein [Magnetococcus sp. DMHC-6]
MSIIHPKYKRLAPRRSYLADEVVLIQAWKKSQRSIRKNNWFADLLELDQSAILLEERIDSWRKQIINGTANPTPMRLVPAPKTHRWGFKNGHWQDVEKDKEGKNKSIHLRPLAHIGIREQTMATAAMLCLADCIETAQGNTSVTNYFQARHQGIHSYGNRLFCTFDEETLGKNNRPLASFHWGNSEIYSRYFEDYRRFQSRPHYIAENIQNQMNEHEEIFIIKLDISAFYDRIHRPTLIARLQNEYKNFRKSYSFTKSTRQFWDHLEQIMAWSWNSNDNELKQQKDEFLPEGLPQGLLASGFFANAYMLEFDRYISRFLEQPLSLKDEHQTNKEAGINLHDITLHDYCRYVDDIRLVVSLKRKCAITEKKMEDELPKRITDWMNNCLKDAANPQEKENSNQFLLEINENKTEVTPFRLVAGQTGTAARMAWIQKNMSGPADMDTLRESTFSLDALLTEADYFDCCTDPTEQVTHPLAKITHQKSDVRDDTLKRFAALRLKNTLRRRRSMTDLNVKLETGISAGDAIDHELEMYARKLVRAWSHDPSLTLVLRLAMDLFPSPDLLRPVLDSLGTLIKTSRRKNAKVSSLIAWYIIADLLRAGAVETGLHARDGELPDTADLTAYQAMLLEFAKRHVLKNRNAPWYAQQQALLLLVSLDPCPTMIPPNPSAEIDHYKTLLKAALYNSEQTLTDEILITHMVFQQLQKNKSRFAVWFLDSLRNLDPSKRIEHLHTVSFNNPDLMQAVLQEMEHRNLNWIDISHDYLKIPQGIRQVSSELNDSNNTYLPLWNIITRTDNPFQHEIPWLRLAKALIKMLHPYQYDLNLIKKVSIRNIRIKVHNWNELGKPEFPENSITVTLDIDNDRSKDPRLAKPNWCENKWMRFYTLGRLLRSAITGEQDFTLTPYLNRHDWDGYNGMRNSWYTRRMGMIHTPETLGGDAAPFSPWVSELLMWLLQWPGARIEPKLIEKSEKIQDMADLLHVINGRLKELEKLYGQASNIPIYPIQIEHTPHRKGILRVVLAQTLIPKQLDFSKLDPCLNHPTYRTIHRNHLNSVCSLILTQLKAQCATENDSIENKTTTLADLIVFPELSVYPDDIWILQRLSDTTKAMMFFGLTPIEKIDSKIINTACWLIPNYRSTGRSWVVRQQGKRHPTDAEKKIGIVAWRPYQVIIELPKTEGNERGYRMTGTICYDATDLNLATDLKNVSDLFIISAMNKDITTFDNMVAALHFHMYQHVVLVNTGEFGGSTVQAPFSEKHEKIVSHLHGGGQLGVSIFDVNVMDFGPGANFTEPQRTKKSPPADFTRFK